MFDPFAADVFGPGVVTGEFFKRDSGDETGGPAQGAEKINSRGTR